MRLSTGWAPGVLAFALLAGCNAIFGIGSNYHRVPPSTGGRGGAGHGGAPGAGRAGARDAGRSGSAAAGDAGDGGASGAMSAGSGPMSEGGASGSTTGEGGDNTHAGGAADGGEQAGGAAGAAGAGVAERCGDGVVGEGEACDDHNASPGDGCSSSCGVESGWVCSRSSPSVCTRPSCAGMSGTECGDGDDCCASPLVTGGTFTQGKGTSGAFASTVSDFRLDRYEVTVARFRRFVDAYDAWVNAGNPTSAAGVNPHVGGSGWQVKWASTLPSNSDGVKAKLACSSDQQTWADAGHDTLPINCVDWPLAFAFCVWDSARLPTEAEWEYAATGGSEQNSYPWGDTPLPTNQQDETALRAVYDCLGDRSAPQVCSFADILTVGSRPLGRGFYGQDDLAGSMDEWVFDLEADYPTSAQTNYANTDTGVKRVVRGGDWLLEASELLVTARSSWVEGTATQTTGFRCARSL
jgi:cysteine-rich repeat protein